jgi:hypothetical protein
MKEVEYRCTGEPTNGLGITLGENHFVQVFDFSGGAYIEMAVMHGAASVRTAVAISAESELALMDILMEREARRIERRKLEGMVSSTSSSVPL